MYMCAHTINLTIYCVVCIKFIVTLFYRPDEVDTSLITNNVAISIVTGVCNTMNTLCKGVYLFALTRLPAAWNILQIRDTFTAMWQQEIV